MVYYTYMDETMNDEVSSLTSEMGYKQAIAQVSDSAIFLLDVKCRITSWNSGGEILKGYTSEEVIGQPFFKLYSEHDQTEGKPLDILRDAVRHGSATEEGWRTRKDGTEFWAHTVTTALYDERKKVIGFIKIVHDYSTHKRLDNQRISLLQSIQTLKKTIATQKSDIKILEKKLLRASKKK